MSKLDDAKTALKKMKDPEADTNGKLRMYVEVWLEHDEEAAALFLGKKDGTLEGVFNHIKEWARKHQKNGSCCTDGEDLRLTLEFFGKKDASALIEEGLGYAVKAEELKRWKPFEADESNSQAPAKMPPKEKPQKIDKESGALDISLEDFL